MSEGGHDRGAIIRAWWQANIANRDSGRARALSARLNRAGPVEALAEAEVHDLAKALHLRDPERPGRLIRLVRVIAAVRENAPQRLAQRLGGAEPVLSTLRFQRLVRATDDELTTGLRRVLPMVDRACNVAALGVDLLDWDHPERGDAIRAHWCFDYFGARAPSATGESEVATPDPEETDA